MISTSYNHATKVIECITQDYDTYIGFVRTIPLTVSVLICPVSLTQGLQGNLGISAQRFMLCFLFHLYFHVYII